MNIYINIIIILLCTLFFFNIYLTYFCIHINIKDNVLTKNKKQILSICISYLYKGMPVLSLNHNNTFTESCGVGGVKSQVKFTLFPTEAQTNLAGTAL